MKNLFTTLLLFGIIYSFSQETAKRKITPTQIDAVFSQWNTQSNPGIAIGILNDGEIVYTKGYGLANLEHQIPITSDTKFHIGDIGKEFTVYALLLLEDREQLSLQDDIRKYIPELMAFPYSISIQKLIHHTSGLNNDEVSKALSGWKQEDIFTKKQAYAMALNQTKAISKDNNFQLPTDTGFMILEDLISKVTKTSYTDFVIKEIFEPLGMSNSVFDTQGNVIANKAQGYFAHNNGFVTSTMNHNHTLVSDVYTTVKDMLLWAKELRNPKIGTNKMVEKFDDLSIVKGQRVEETNTALYSGGHRYWNFRGSKKLYHIEVAGGYASKLIRYPDYDLAVVIMGNDGAYNGYAGTGVSELYIEDFLDPISSNNSTKIVSKKLSKKQLSKFEGDYWDINSYATRKIHIVNDTLRYYRGPGNESALVPLTKNSFKMITWGDVKVSFDTKASPKIMDVIVNDVTSNLVAFDKKAEWTKNLDGFIGNYNSETLGTSYSIVLRDGKLILTHRRLESVELNPKIRDVFSGNKRHYSSLTFKRNLEGNIEGFKLSTNGISDIWFKKEIILSQKSIGTK